MPVSRSRAAAMGALLFLELAAGQCQGGSPAVTNLSQLRAAAGASHSVVESLHIEGTVWWSCAGTGGVILSDESGIEQLDLNFPCKMPAPGQRLLLEGSCTVMNSRGVLALSSVPVVDNDGLHPAQEKSGTISLKAGRHPIRLDYFNRTGEYELEVLYGADGLAQLKIADDALFRTEADSSGRGTNFVNGLDYRAFEGMWWSELPDFNHLKPVRAGTVRNFDLSARTRDTQMGLQYSGFILITNAGIYTFHTRSDDGTRLFIGEPTIEAKVLGESVLPPPQASAGSVSNSTGNFYRRTQIEGTVSFVNEDSQPLEIELNTGAGPLRLLLAEGFRKGHVLAPKSRIQAAGVIHDIFLSDGRRVHGEFFVQGWNDIQQIPEPQNNYPLFSIREALAMPGGAGRETEVHLLGKLRAGTNAPAMILEDESGSVILETDATNFDAGQEVEVLGQVTAEGGSPLLKCGAMRHRDGNTRDALPVLSLAKQIDELSPRELNREHLVKLRGVVTCILPWNGVILQDPTRAENIFIGKPNSLRVGDYCDVEGVTAAGDFSPYVRASRVESLGVAALPAPARPTRDQLLNGSMHAQYVELEGVVTSIEEDDLTLLTREGRLKVNFEAQERALPRQYENALVRLRGCLLNDWDKQAQRINVGHIFMDPLAVDVVQPAPADPFAIVTRHVDELLHFDPRAGALQRVKVSGQIVHIGQPLCFLQDRQSGLRFMPVRTNSLALGDTVEVVGFPEFSGPSPLIQEAVVRRRLGGIRPGPLKLTEDLLNDEYDSRLVQIEGLLTGISASAGRLALDVRSGDRGFTAFLAGNSDIQQKVPVGCKLLLTGVYVGQGGNRVLGQSIDSFQLMLNSPADVQVLARPTWWTLRRMLPLVGVLACVLVLALVWVKMLHQRVAERTVQLEAEILERQRAEQQREIEQERTRVAHDLHDDLGAGLTEVSMLTTLLKSPAATLEEKNQYVEQLNALAEHMVGSLDEIVWAMNPRNDTVASLASYFAAYAQSLLELASVTCALEIPGRLPDLHLDSRFRHAVFLAFKEALNNVIRHADATKVWLRIVVEGQKLIVTVRDNGRGFEHGRNGTPGDGLENMRERLGALGGQCTIESEPANGTTVRFESSLPAALEPIPSIP